MVSEGLEAYSLVLTLHTDFSSGSAQFASTHFVSHNQLKMTSRSSVLESCRRKVWEGFWWFGMRDGGLGRGMVVWGKEWWFGARNGGLGRGMVVWLDMCWWCEKDYGFCNSPHLLVDT